MCKTEVPCPCSRSQPGVRGQLKGPSGAFVTYCNISCLLFFIIINFNYIITVNHNRSTALEGSAQINKVGLLQSVLRAYNPHPVLNSDIQVIQSVMRSSNSSIDWTCTKSIKYWLIKWTVIKCIIISQDRHCLF